MNTRALITHHYGFYLRWRKARLGAMASLPAAQSSTAQDRTDILEADRELARELALVDRQAALAAAPMSAGLVPAGQAVVDALWRNKMDQWPAIRSVWMDPGPLPSSVAALFDAFVHDSRAWFKPFGDNDDDWANAVAADAHDAAELRRQAAREMEAAAAAPGADP